MTAAFIFEQLINGLSQGSIFALFAIGYALIVGVVGMATLCHGEVIMIGGFMAFFTISLSWIPTNIIVMALICFIVPALVGIVIHIICYEKFLDSPRHISLVCTIGMSILLINLAQIVFGTQTQGVRTNQVIQPRSFEVFGVFIGMIEITIFIVVIVLCILLALFLNKTKYGVVLKAVSQNRKAAALMGVNVKRATMVGSLLGCGIAGIGGMLFALYYSSISPLIGPPVMIRAFSATVLGGMSDISMSALGGIVIGVMENFGIAFAGSAMRDIFAFMFLILVLLFLPEGLRLGGGRRRGR
ncbi:MAG: branched-chain amino acid ABC transporter permease [Defluviitaleaceae bacterium]|nr:branched-chain amino acid ABC transporter permease [Defluviitaleaceae bacterium]